MRNILAAFVSVLLVLGVLRGFPSLKSNLLLSENLPLIARDEGQGKVLSRLAAGRLLASDDQDACLALIESRLLAISGLGEDARERATFAQNCDRRELVARWSGQLAWMNNDTESASAFWSQLNASNLIGWGTYLVAAEDIDRATVLLQHAYMQQESGLTTREQIKLYEGLGRIYLENGDISSALVLLHRAWSLSGQNYRSSYELALAYFEKGDYSQAVDVLETGLENRDSPRRPLYDVAYLVLLGRAHVAIGNTERAGDYLTLAASTLNENKASMSAERFREQQSWITHLLASVED